jgi:hypothetical protein
LRRFPGQHYRPIQLIQRCAAAGRAQFDQPFVNPQRLSRPTSSMFERLGLSAAGGWDKISDLF